MSDKKRQTVLLSVASFLVAGTALYWFVLRDTGLGAPEATGLQVADGKHRDRPPAIDGNQPRTRPRPAGALPDKPEVNRRPERIRDDSRGPSRRPDRRKTPTRIEKPKPPAA